MHLTSLCKESFQRCPTYATRMQILISTGCPHVSGVVKICQQESSQMDRIENRLEGCHSCISTRARTHVIILVLFAYLLHGFWSWWVCTCHLHVCCMFSWYCLPTVVRCLEGVFFTIVIIIVCLGRCYALLLA